MGESSLKIGIAHIAGGLTTGGVEAVIYNYFLHMPRDKYQLIYISYDKPDEKVKRKFENLGFIVFEVEKKKNNFVKSCWQVFQIFRKYNVKIVHSHMTLMSFVTSYIGRLAGIKIRIAHAHLAQKPKGIKRFAYAVFKMLTKLSSNYYFACGQDAAEYLYGKRFVLKKSIYYMKNAVSLSKYKYSKEKREAIRSQMGIGDNYLLGNVGRFTEQKNHIFLIQIFKEVKKKIPSAKLVLIGDGPLRVKVNQLVKEMKLESDVIFVGSIHNVEDYYSAMDLFVLPSLYEGLSVALVEAQTSGVAILSSDTVTKEIMILDNYFQVSLSSNTQIWADKIVQINADNLSRVDSLNQIREAGYDIIKEAEKLDLFYERCVKMNQKGT